MTETEAAAKAREMNRTTYKDSWIGVIPAKAGDGWTIIGVAKSAAREYERKTTPTRPPAA